MATMGKFFANRRNHIPNQPKEPARIPQSAQVGFNMPHAQGTKSLLRDETMITYRSNHIPILIKIEITNSEVTLRRIFRNQSSCDTNALQMIMVQPAHHWGPKARRKKVVCSKIFPLYQATKYSIA